MKKFINIFLYGASIHPGNPIYIVFSIACFLAGLRNEDAPWWIGLTVLIILIPLYIYTSYDAGKETWNEKESK